MPVVLKLVLIGVSLLAAFFDLRVRRIPNWINVCGIVLGLSLNTYFGGSSGALKAGVGILLALVIYLPLYALKGMGAGDVKVMAAIGAIVGPWSWLDIFVATALLGGVASIALTAWHKRTGETLNNVAVIVSQVAHGKLPAQHDQRLSIHGKGALKMPHGAVIAAGVGVFLILHWNA